MVKKKRATWCIEAPAFAGSGKGSHHLVYCFSLFLHKRLFPGLEPVTDNNFTSCAKVTLCYFTMVMQLNSLISVQMAWAATQSKEKGFQIWA